MTVTGLTNQQRITTYPMMRRTITAGLALAMTVAPSGCINVTAPDKPIEINLNINVTQEVVYRLDGDAKSLIKQNPGIF
ncbi:YnbE family lipoprotein [Sphingomonas oligophenolica]|nr:YnbE family lipoprotein [Sphingomonas oligophenolica]